MSTDSRGWKKLAMRTAAVVTAVAVTGCVDIDGGGWIPSVTTGYRATFGFTSHCTDTVSGAMLNGQIQYVDHGVIIPNAKGKGSHPLAVNMSLDKLFDNQPIPVACGDLDANIWTMITHLPPAPGTEGRILPYCPQPSNGSDCGLALVVVRDTGARGPAKGDLFAIALYPTGAGFPGAPAYSNQGALGGGNITVGTP